MAKSAKREWVFPQVNVQGGVPKLELKKYCPRLRKHTVHRIKRK
jgi:ribosomal protein L33